MLNSTSIAKRIIVQSTAFAYTDSHKLNCAYASGHTAARMQVIRIYSCVSWSRKKNKMNHLSRELRRKIEFRCRCYAAFELKYTYTHTLVGALDTDFIMSVSRSR